jgi:hypothetical protein
MLIDSNDSPDFDMKNTERLAVMYSVGHILFS